MSPLLHFCTSCMHAQSCLTLLQPHELYAAHQAPLSMGILQTGVL